MKLLTLNFLTCARKACKSSTASFPLHPKDAELEIVEQDLQPLFLRNILPRVEWDALVMLCSELGLPQLPPTAPESEQLIEKKLNPDTTSSSGMEVQTEEIPTQLARDLHRVLLETCVKEGKLCCGNCGHEYWVKEGIANFLLPGHLV